MTEAEWLGANVGLMLDFLDTTNAPKSRKLRLLAVAYARFLEAQPEYADSKHVAHLGEEVADGQITIEEQWKSPKTDWKQLTGNWGIANLVLASGGIGDKIRVHLYLLFQNPDPAVRKARVEQHTAIVRPLIRCVFGNPFRPVAFNPAWRTDTAVALARQMYESRDFGAMPILADALQDAGCENEQILTHCRDAGPHARGCWVVDGVLGKA